MSDFNHFRQQAERCLRLARMCSDSTMAERLRQTALEFQEQADRPSMARTGSEPGGIGRG